MPRRQTPPSDKVRLDSTKRFYRDFRKAVAYYRSGESLRALGRRYGIGANTIKAAFKTRGIPIRPRGAPLPGKKKAMKQAAGLYKKGLSTLEIGRRLGCSHSSVANMLRSAGVELNPPGRLAKWDERTLRKMVRLHRHGLTVKAIAKEVGRDRHAVSRKLKALNHVPRPRGDVSKMPPGPATVFTKAQMAVLREVIRETVKEELSRTMKETGRR